MESEEKREKSVRKLKKNLKLLMFLLLKKCLWKMTTIILKWKMTLIFLKMEDDLIFFENGRRPHKNNTTRNN